MRPQARARSGWSDQESQLCCVGDVSVWANRLHGHDVLRLCILAAQHGPGGVMHIENKHRAVLHANSFRAKIGQGIGSSDHGGQPTLWQMKNIPKQQMRRIMHIDNQQISIILRHIGNRADNPHAAYLRRRVDIAKRNRGSRVAQMVI